MKLKEYLKLNRITNKRFFKSDWHFPSFTFKIYKRREGTRKRNCFKNFEITHGSVSPDDFYLQKKDKYELNTEQEKLIGLMSRQLKSGSKKALAKTITLVESKLKKDKLLVQKIFEKFKKNNNTIRIGITGVPGVGKSTFIESLGLFLIEKSHKVAVLAIDPSSKESGGSILGDKTRMEKLSINSSAFIRPSPSDGHLEVLQKNL